MRTSLTFLPLLMCASPALAQHAPPQLPPELTNPQTLQRLAGTMQALSNALLNLKVGEITAALDGRRPTPQERNLTVGDLARRHDPNFDRHIRQQVAEVGPMVQHNMQALNRALPEMMKNLESAQKSLERAVANMPDPTYPQR